MNKMGVSEVIMLVLIILITIISLAIVWSFAKPSIEKIIGTENTEGNLESSLICLNLNINIERCAQISPGNYQVSIGRGPGEEKVNSIRFFFESNQGAKEEENQSSLEEFGSAIFNFAFDENTIISNVHIAAKLKDGLLCDISQVADCTLGDAGQRNNSYECSDSLDNDLDSFIDYPNDPGCDGEEDNSESGESEAHNFQFLFASDGFLQELNWSDGINWKRVSWDEKGRLIGGVWHQYYLHSRTTNDNKEEGWLYEKEDGTIVQENHSLLTYTKEYEGTRSARIKVEGQSRGMEIEDSILFSEDSILIQTTIKNNLNEKIKATIPLNLGALQLTGNKYRIKPIYGGIIESFASEGNHYKYPSDIQSYSPISVLWGSSMTIGQQYLSSLEIPTDIEFIQKPAARNSPLISNLIKIELAPWETKTLTISFTLSNGGDWQTALSPYKSWFNNIYGNNPQYCPTGPWAFGNARNMGRTSRVYNPGPGNPLYNSSFPAERWYPNTSIRQVYNNPVFLNVRELELKMYGIWATSLYSSYLTNDGQANEYGPRVDLIDPNIDIGNNNSKINELVNSFKANGTEVIWYTRPCADIEGADIIFDQNGNYSFQTGEFKEPLDLRTQADKDILLNRMEFFVSKGVKAIYADHTACAGERQATKEILQQLQSEYEKILFIREGARDVDSLLWPQLAIIPTGTQNNSNLIFWLVPNATYYEGKIGQPLTDSEIFEFIKKGFQPVLDNSLRSRAPADIQKWKNWTCNSYPNQLNRWQSYGSGISDCVAPVMPSYCCSQGFLGQPYC